MIKTRFSQRVRHFAGLVLILTSLTIYFQNCSNVKFVEGTDTLASELDGNTANKFGRTQIINPSYSQVATTGDIKVLLVVDNSPTMQNSQANLNKNLAALLGQIQNYSASVKVVSSTLFDTSCSNNSNCSSKPVLNYGWSNTAITLEGRAGVAYSTGLSENPQNITFKFEKSMTAAQRESVFNSIRSRVTDLGTRGADSESQMAAFAVHLDTSLSSFFKKGDKALIYVLTDEEDSYSISSLQQTRSGYSESATWYTYSPGLQYYYAAFVTSSATCMLYDEAGNYKGMDFRSPLAFTSLTSCNEFLANNSNSNCNWGTTCTASEAHNNFTYTLDNKSLATRCAEVTNEVKGYHTVTRCMNAEASTYHAISGNSYASYLLGFTKESFAANPRDVILKTVKNKLQDLFGSKYLIGVSTNLAGQSCALKTGQSYDTFFSKSLAAEIPASNLLVTSICDANTSDQAVKRIASEFDSIMNNDYLVSLAPYESISEVRAVVSGRSLILKDGVDYKIVSNTFKILSTALQNFERIEIQIKSKN